MIDATDDDICPHCGANLLGAPIPQEHIDAGFYVSTHYSRKIGINVRGVYDGVLFWQCPDCGGTWHRWVNNEYLRDKADAAVRGETPLSEE